VTDRRQPPSKPGPRVSSHSVGVALVVVAAAGFGSGALFAKPVYAAGVDWLTLLFWRFLVAAALSWVWLLLIPGNRSSLRRLTRRRVAILIVLGVIYVTNSGTYFAALETVPASLAALIVYLYPALVAVLSIRFGRRLEGRRAWLALGISTLGVALAVGGIPQGGGPPILGLALAVASPIIYAFWIVMAARLGGERRDRLPQGVSGMPRSAPAAGIPPQDAEAAPAAETESAPAAALMTTASAVVFTLAMLVTGRSVSPASIPGEAWVGLLGIAVLSTAVALQTFYAGARRVGAARASLISTVEPIYTITLASILFHETLAPVQLLGGALIIGGVLLAESGQGESVAVQATDASREPASVL
jgi:drug/metabolite transporter (DMT)-like permease